MNTALLCMPVVYCASGRGLYIGKQTPPRGGGGGISAMYSNLPPRGGGGGYQLCTVILGGKYGNEKTKTGKIRKKKEGKCEVKGYNKCKTGSD
jgi:hypothetical protein